MPLSSSPLALLGVGNQILVRYDEKPTGWWLPRCAIGSQQFVWDCANIRCKLQAGRYYRTVVTAQDRCGSWKLMPIEEVVPTDLLRCFDPEQAVSLLPVRYHNVMFDRDDSTDRLVAKVGEWRFELDPEAKMEVVRNRRYGVELTTQVSTTVWRVRPIGPIVPSDLQIAFFVRPVNPGRHAAVTYIRWGDRLGIVGLSEEERWPESEPAPDSWWTVRVIEPTVPAPRFVFIAPGEKLPDLTRYDAASPEMLSA